MEHYKLSEKQIKLYKNFSEDYQLYEVEIDFTEKNMFKYTEWFVSFLKENNKKRIYLLVLIGNTYNSFVLPKEIVPPSLGGVSYPRHSELKNENFKLLRKVEKISYNEQLEFSF